MNEYDALAAELRELREQRERLYFRDQADLPYKDIDSNRKQKKDFEDFGAARLDALTRAVLLDCEMRKSGLWEDSNNPPDPKKIQNKESSSIIFLISGILIGVGIAILLVSVIK